MTSDLLYTHEQQSSPYLCTLSQENRFPDWLKLAQIGFSLAVAFELEFECRDHAHRVRGVNITLTLAKSHWFSN